MPNIKRTRVIQPTSLMVILLTLFATALILVPTGSALGQEQSADAPTTPTGLTRTAAHDAVTLN